MSGSNCSFLTHIQISQETGKVVWYSYLSKNFPQFVVIHTVKGFSIVNEAEVDVFQDFFFFSGILLFSPCPTNIGYLLSGSSDSLKPNLYIWKFLTIVQEFMYFWSLAWRILSTNFLTCEMSATVWYFEHSLTLPFIGIGMKTDLF